MTTTAPSPTTLSARAPITALPTTASLPQAAQAASLRGLPLVVMTTLRGCPYCDLVRSRYLGPMLRDGELLAIQIDMTDARSELTAFDGTPTTPRNQVKAWKAAVAPTVLFLSPQGEELAERLVGVAVEEMYGDYLHVRMEESKAKLKPSKR